MSPIEKAAITVIPGVAFVVVALVVFALIQPASFDQCLAKRGKDVHTEYAMRAVARICRDQFPRPIVMPSGEVFETHHDLQTRILIGLGLASSVDDHPME